LKPTYDRVTGKFISPDKILLATGIKDYQKGKYQSALLNFKKAAAFGNSEAQKFIGLMHIKSLGVSQNWAKGYAWIKLAALDNSTKHNDLKNSIYTHLKPAEKKNVDKDYAEIIKDYGISATDKRRYKWYRKQKKNTLGSRAGAQTSVIKQQRILNNGKHKMIIDKNGESSLGLDSMNHFVVNYNFGIVESRKNVVNLGEVIPVED
jgi:hypothetical protein